MPRISVKLFFPILHLAEVLPVHLVVSEAAAEEGS